MGRVTEFGLPLTAAFRFRVVALKVLSVKFVWVSIYYDE
jgi:hypothetical protein